MLSFSFYVFVTGLMDYFLFKLDLDWIAKTKPQHCNRWYVCRLCTPYFMFILWFFCSQTTVSKIIWSLRLIYFFKTALRSLWNYFQLLSDSRSKMVGIFCVSRRGNGTDGLHSTHYIIASLWSCKCANNHLNIKWSMNLAF